MKKTVIITLTTLYILIVAITIQAYFTYKETANNARQIYQEAGEKYREYLQSTFNSAILERCEQCKMYNLTGIEGVHYPNQKYYCVWTEGRNLTEIQQTDYHENCHALTHEDYYHFCQQYHQK